MTQNNFKMERKMNIGWMGEEVALLPKSQGMKRTGKREIIDRVAMFFSLFAPVFNPHGTRAIAHYHALICAPVSYLAPNMRILRHKEGNSWGKSWVKSLITTSLCFTYRLYGRINAVITPQLIRH
jgi:hypothetical protein